MADLPALIQAEILADILIWEDYKPQPSLNKTLRNANNGFIHGA